MTSGQPQPLLAGVLAALSLDHGSTRFARVGIDVVSVAWFARQLASHPAGAAPIELSLFTSAERTYCAGRPERYAVRWAAKEAVAKAIGTGFRGGACAPQTSRSTTTLRASRSSAPQTAAPGLRPPTGGAGP